MRSAPAQLPDDIEALKRLVLEREAQLEIARHNERAHLTLIEHLKLQIARLKRMQFGRSSEKLQTQIEQLELIVEDLEQEQASTAPEAPVQAKAARQQPVRRPLPEHLPRETVRHEPEAGCPECGGNLKAIGEDVAEMLEYVPASFKVIRHVRPRMACAAASGSCRGRRQAGRLRGAWPARDCWRMYWCPSTRTTCRCIGSRASTRARAWSWSARRWPTGWGRPRDCSRRWSRRWAVM
jgi:hypothetical protein